MNPNPTPQTCYGRDRRQPAPVDLSDVPQRICNSSSRQPYIPNDKTVYRPGSDVRVPSRGVSC